MKFIFCLLIIAAILGITAPGLWASGGQAETQIMPADPTKTAQTGEDTKLFGGLTEFYLLGLSLVGISALLMMVWGGIYITIAGDNTGLLGKGKQKIQNALWGILLAGISYALLYTINPDLVTLRLGGTAPQTTQQN